MLWGYSTKYCLQMGIFAVASALLLVTSQSAAAEEASACLQHPAKLPAAVVTAFMSRPADLLDQHPDGGVVMSALVKRLAGSDIATVSPLVYLARDAKLSQVVATGVGLAGTVNVCKRKRPDVAQRIMDEVKRAAISTLSTAFSASLTPDNVFAFGAPDEIEVVREPVFGLDLSKRRGDAAQEVPAEKPPGESQPAIFGTGGIAQTVVRPVSPAR